MTNSNVNTHQLVKEAKALLKAWPKTNRQHRKGDYLRSTELCLDIRVTESSLERALSIIDCLIRRLEERGHKVELKESNYEKTVAIINDEKVSFCVFELRKLKSKVKYSPEYSPVEYEPSGKLSIDLGYGTFNLRKSFNDGKRNKVEDYIDEIILTMEEVSKRSKLNREDNERRQKESRAREELLKIELDKIDNLLVVTKQFYFYKEIKELLGKLKSDESKKSLEFTKWLSWADTFCEQQNPLHWTSDEIINAKNNELGFDAKKHELQKSFLRMW